MHTPGSHLSKDLVDLIKAIGDSRSKQEEDKIIVKECETLKKKIKESNISPRRMKEYLIRAIYIEMLGHEASFAHLHSVNLTQDKNLLNKRVGYLACCLLLSDQSEFLIMLVASLQKDIQSINWVEVCMALTAVVKFANNTIVQAVTEPILKLLEHKNEHIRKKAVMCLYKFHQVSPMSVPDCDERMRRLLCDFDPSVMAATLPYFKEMALKNPAKYKDLVAPLTSILKQVIEHKLVREFDYHRFPAPWIQVILLEILSILGADDKAASENMYEILQQCLRRADDTGINIGYAIVYQCLKTICTIYPNPHLIELASNTISRFLISESPNLRCTGINGLALIIQINPNYVMNRQQCIVDCLEENDETLKKNTFEILYKMTNLKNVEVIVDKMMNYLKHTTLESASKKDILTKITELTERFAPSKTWFIKIMNQLFVNFGDMITDDILSKLIKIIDEWESETEDIEEFKSYTIENYANIVENYAVLHDSFVKLMAWVIGEYTNKLYVGDKDKISKILEMLTYLLTKSYDDEMTKCLLITAIAKIHSNMDFFPQLDFVTDVIEKYSRNKNPEIQQRCLEYKRMASKRQRVYKNNFTTIVDDVNVDVNLSFLNNYVKEKCNGKVYDAEFAERVFDKFNSNESQLNIGPYESQTTLWSNPTEGSKFNTLYESKDNNLAKTMKSELNVKVQRWGEEGYKEEKQFERGKQTFTNVTSVSSDSTKGVNAVSSVSGGNVSSSNSGNGPYGGVSSDNVQSSGSVGVYRSSGNVGSKKNENVYDGNSKEKKKLMKDLFGGFGDSGSNDTSDNKESYVKKGNKTERNVNKGNTNIGGNTNNNSAKGLFDNMTLTGSNKQPVQQHQQQQQQQPQQQSVNLLGLGFNEQPSMPPQQQQQPQTTTTTTSIDLLNDIFGGGMPSTTSTPTTSFPSSSTTTTQQPSLFDAFNLTQPQPQPQPEYTPYKITTDTFGEQWETFPEEDAYSFTTSFPMTPQQFHSIITSKGNFSAVEIINNEAISSAYYKQCSVLVHATITNTEIDLLVKCSNKSLNTEISNYIISLFK